MCGTSLGTANAAIAAVQFYLVKRKGLDQAAKALHTRSSHYLEGAPKDHSHSKPGGSREGSLLRDHWGVGVTGRVGQEGDGRDVGGGAW